MPFSLELVQQSYRPTSLPPWQAEEYLDIVQKGLSDYINTKRDGFGL